MRWAGGVRGVDAGAGDQRVVDVQGGENRRGTEPRVKKFRLPSNKVRVVCVSGRHRGRMGVGSGGL
jgi:hypothetical protein